MKRFVLTALASLMLANAVNAQSVDVQSAAKKKAKTDPGNLGAQWWQLAVSLPTTVSPFIDQTKCGFGQVGATWFLYSTSPVHEAVGEPTSDECTIPTGKRILLSLLANFCIADFGTTLEENCAPEASGLDTPTVLRLEIDGVDYASLIERRTSGRPFTLPVPAGNSFDLPSGIFTAVHDGYFALLPPLTTGDHTIVYQGAFITPDGQPIAFDTIHVVHIVEPSATLPPADQAVQR
jgi:hypothetical protein